VTTPASEPVSVGFGSADLSAALPADLPVRDPVVARAFHVRSTDTRTVWVVLDFMDLNRPFVEAVGAEVGRRTGVPLSHVHVLSTHNHAASELDRLDVAEASRAAADAAAGAVEAAAPAHMAYSQTHVAPALTLTRRRAVAELDGAISCFYGVTAEEGFSCESILRQAVRSLVQKGRMAYADRDLDQPVPQEAFIDTRRADDPQAWRMPAGDPLLQVLRFETAAGRPLGTVVRYACHVVNCNGQGFYSGDFPHFLSRALEEQLDGGCVFLNGPCADLAPATPHKRAGYERTMGERLADVTATALEGQPRAPVTVLRDLALPVSLPVRPDFPLDEAELECRLERARAACEAVPAHDLATRKRLGEQVAMLSTTPFLRQRWVPGEEPAHLERDNPVLRVELGGLRLNEVSLIAYPGETFRATGEAAAATANGPVITATEHGRTAMYMPPPEQLAQQGYEFTCRLVTERGEPTLREAGLALLRRLRR